ncbi:hypothetical protein NDU88_007199 [Pleurodeles waltl]|uniref:Uncharacterized protein n=1 Tax=Pleurodeles waltl TaxID=8319 RepID=A0AAV7N2S3_PLEWA|nr:hypothetical protein NDU88_007199 [Pleurodeles waltl]
MRVKSQLCASAIDLQTVTHYQDTLLLAMYFHASSRIRALPFMRVCISFMCARLSFGSRISFIAGFIRNTSRLLTQLSSSPTARLLLLESPAFQKSRLSSWETAGFQSRITINI